MNHVNDNMHPLCLVSLACLEFLRPTCRCDRYKAEVKGLWLFSITGVVA